ncbi:hypothetical protein P3C29_02400 [Pseudomonas sp. 1912-s]|uniref:hypothetical protein n=1 Tax=Pseudomonas sp. 1912-s TaxID=3033802 RepID=UPI0023DF688D|nr:hypothetical protein [Pseudomonas sp. 1912-s]MDF3197512.1 hypothetical protein [Pseudomonas sp. 1912-s]
MGKIAEFENFLADISTDYGKVHAPKTGAWRVYLAVSQEHNYMMDRIFAFTDLPIRLLIHVGGAGELLFGLAFQFDLSERLALLVGIVLRVPVDFLLSKKIYSENLNYLER